MRYAFAVILACAATAHSAGLYKWTDPNGQTQYSDVPPPANAKNVQQRKVAPNVIPSSGPSYGQQEAAKNFPVTLWVTECGELCAKARALLNQRGIPYTEKNPQNPGDGETFKKLSGPDMQVPLMQIGELKTIKGFEENEWGAALDVAGYPKNAPAVKGPANKPPG